MIEPTIGLAPCWSCGATGPCVQGCRCAKCADPEDYATWKRRHPDRHRAWVQRQRDLAKVAVLLRTVQIDVGRAYAFLLDAKDDVDQEGRG